MFLRRSAPVYLILGVFAFGNVSRNPRFASFHTVDILQLLVCGMCLGLAMAALIARRRGLAFKGDA